MPNRATHQPIAIITGTIAGFAAASQQPPRERIVETIGGSIGGWATGMLADCLDPPDHPHHRGIGHALLPNALASAVYVNIASDWQRALRAKAATFAQAAAQALTPIEQCWYQFLELACLALAGALAGHWSHLYLDSQTCFGIPLVCPGY